MIELKVEVKDIYEGPMDLLISLIKKDKIDIMDIPMNEITTGFIESMEEINFTNIDMCLDFSNMAAELLEIKSKMLLPIEEEIEDEDPRLDLVNRILEYNYYKSISNILNDYYKDARGYLLKKPEDISLIYDQESIEYESLQVESLTKALVNLLSEQNKIESDLEFDIEVETLTISDCIKDIELKLSSKKVLKFSDVLNDKISKIDIISYFLAILEMSKENIIYIKQETGQTDIIIKRKNNGK